MSQKSYSRSAGVMSGTGKVVVGAPVLSHLSPEIQRDTEMLRQVFTNALRQARAKQIDGTYTFENRQYYTWLKSFWLGHCRNPRRLSEKMREFCMKQLKLDKLPELPEVQPPLGLRGPLPKRPPVAKKMEDDDE